MSPRETAFNKENVLAAAIGLVRREGLEKLTARAIADELKASVAPVYSTFGNMDSLQKEILEAARRLLLDKTAEAWTEGAFLNIGVGMVVFARDEGPLFRALFYTRHGHSEIIESIFTAILETMKADPMLRLLKDASLERLLDNLGTYTLGLAGAVLYGRLEDSSTEAIIRHLKNAGNMMILGEITGTADSESPENDVFWQRILEDKNIALPQRKENL
jgi:AcrR family transcriptional regulator